MAKRNILKHVGVLIVMTLGSINCWGQANEAKSVFSCLIAPIGLKEKSYKLEFNDNGLLICEFGTRVSPSLSKIELLKVADRKGTFVPKDEEDKIKRLTDEISLLPEIKNKAILRGGWECVIRIRNRDYQVNLMELEHTDKHIADLIKWILESSPLKVKLIGFS